MKKEVVERVIKNSKRFVILTERNTDQVFYSDNLTYLRAINFDARLNNALKESEKHKVNFETVVRDFNDDYIEMAVRIFVDENHCTSATHIIPYENIKEIIIYN